MPLHNIYCTRSRSSSASQFRESFEHAAVGLAHTAADGRFLRVNPKLCSLLGYSESDLLQVSQRLASCVRAGDTVGRLGGDEFVIVLPEIAEAKHSGLIARKVIAALARPFQLGGHEVSISASVGIASYREDGDTVEALIRNADSAMFSAKQSGRDGFRFFAAELDA